MSQTIKYIGTQDNWFEVAVTGKQSCWKIGQQEERSDSEAQALLVTGLFSALAVPVMASVNLTGGNTIPALDAMTGTVAASRSLIKEDSGQTLICTSASAIVLTIPNDATVEWSGLNAVAAYQGGAGAVSFAAGSGVTIRGTAPTAAQYATQGVMRVGSNEWAYL